MSFVPGQNLDQTAFGELAVAQPYPEVQISAVNGLRDDILVVEAGTGADVSVVDGNYEISSGADAGGLAACLTNKQATYRNGQGLLGRFTALFPSNAANNLQFAGFINSDNIFAFGYDGTEFGVVRGYDGKAELQRLQITTPAGGAENATVTVNGTGYTVPLTSGTVQDNAFEVAQSLNAQVPNYNFSSNDDEVTALAGTPTAAGSFAFTSATAAGTWTQVTAGRSATFDWVPLADWTNPPSWTIDPTKGNVFQIRIQYLGYGGIRFYVENPETAEFELVHVYQYANANTIPHVTNPTFRIGWASQNIGNTSNITVKGASAGAFVEGLKVFDERGRTASGEVLSLTAGARLNILTIRNRLDINGVTNRTTVYPQVLLIGGDHNKAIIFHVDAGTTFLDPMIFEYIDEQSSVVEFSTSAAEVDQDGREVATFRYRGIGTLEIDISRFFSELNPSESLTISAITASGTGAEADCSLVWLEDP